MKKSPCAAKGDAGATLRSCWHWPWRWLADQAFTRWPLIAAVLMLPKKSPVPC